jgi:hypothetical protein
MGCVDREAVERGAGACIVVVGIRIMLRKFRIFWPILVIFGDFFGILIKECLF